jgi:hypothetical protein
MLLIKKRPVVILNTMTIHQIGISGPVPLEFWLMIKDTYKRPLRDLRISVTDRCNFRCT